MPSLRTTTLAVGIATLALLCLRAQADDLPDIRPGLWEMHMKMSAAAGAPGMDRVMKVCQDSSSKKRMDAAGPGGGDCNTTFRKIDASHYEMSSHCTSAQSTINSVGTVTVAADTMHTEIRTAYSPPMAGMQQTTMTRDDRYLGACPANMQPGDQIGLNGAVVHPRQ